MRLNRSHLHGAPSSERFPSVRLILPFAIWLPLVCKRLSSVGTLFVLGFLAPSIYAQTISVDAATVDVGAVQKGSVITKDFSVTNTGSADLHITDVKAACSCTTAKFDKRIRPGGKGTRLRLTPTASVVLS